MMFVRSWLRAVFLLLALWGTAPVAHALTFTVSKTADTADGTCNADCSLREAIIAANSSGGDDTIVFSASAFAAEQTINLTGALPDLSSNIAIQNSNARVTVRRDTGGNYRIFTIGIGKTVSLSGLTLTNGLSDDGGAIYNNDGVLTLSNCTISGNTAIDGGGIYTFSGTLTLSNCTISNNVANSTGAGGGIYSESGDVALTSCIVSGNSAEDSPRLNNYGSVGGGIFSDGTTGILTVTNSAIISNTATNGGGIMNDSGRVTLTNSVVSLNTVRNSTSASTYSGGGGGIFNVDFGEITAINSTISHNGADQAGGGIRNLTGAVTLTSCTVSNNSGSVGGGIHNTFAELNLINCTISTNNAYQSHGGAIYAGDLDIASAGVTLDSCTIANNTASASFYGGVFVESDTITLRNTIVFGNTLRDVSVDGTSTLTSVGHNLIGTSNAAASFNQTGDQHGVADAKLGPLADNGGLSHTHALLPDSPAIDAGEATQTTDQRGVARPLGSADDIGAFEFDPPQSGPNFVVNSNADTDDGACTVTHCTLREAINAANSNADTSIITFAAGVTGTINLTGALPTLNSNINIQGPGANVLNVRRDTGGDYGILVVSSGKTVSIAGLTISNGFTALNDNGGGIDNSGTLAVRNCALTGNTGNNVGGGISNSGTLTVENSTLSGNVGVFGGGGIYNSGTATVINSTISGNSTTPGFGGAGGGIGSEGAAIVTVTNSTITGNSCFDQGGGIHVFGSTTLRNSIVALNTLSDGTNGPDISGAVQAVSSFNLIGNGTNMTGITNGTSGNQIGTGAVPLDAKLGPIADNGGPTKTHALLTGSPAISGGDPAFDGLGQFDQRGAGFSRVNGGRLDIGAFEVLPPTLSINNVTKAEGNSGTSNATFTVTLSAASSQTVTVNYATANGTATQPGDYTTASGTLTFTSGQTSKTIAVPIVGDTLDEDNETFTVTLSAATNAAIATAIGTGTITDDDATPTIVINDPRAQYEGSAAAPGSTFFKVSLSQASGREVRVNYQTTDGVTNGAKAGEDYVATSGTLIFAPGQLFRTVTVNFMGDNTPEQSEPLFLDLKTPVNATIADSRGVLYIRNDDGPQIFIDDAKTVDEGNSSTRPQSFTVRLSAASPDTVTVDWTTLNNTAGPADYVVASGTLTFAPGETTKTITVQVKGDTTVEPTETYRVRLNRAFLATIGDSVGIGYIRNDDAAPLLFEDDAPSE